MKWINHRTFQRVVAQTNIFDTAIGFAVAVSFIKLVNTFVTSLLTPVLGGVIGGKSLSQYKLIFTFPINGNEPVLFEYGTFLDVCIEFFFVVLFVYWTARLVLRIKKRGIEAIEKQKPCAECAMQIPEKAKTCPYCQTELC